MEERGGVLQKGRYKGRDRWCGRHGVRWEGVHARDSKEGGGKGEGEGPQSGGETLTVGIGSRSRGMAQEGSELWAH